MFSFSTRFTSIFVINFSVFFYHDFDLFIFSSENRFTYNEPGDFLMYRNIAQKVEVNHSCFFSFFFMQVEKKLCCIFKTGSRTRLDMCEFQSNLCMWCSNKRRKRRHRVIYMQQHAYKWRRESNKTICKKKKPWTIG